MTKGEQKRVAAEAAAAEVQDGMRLGLGTGSTASLVVEALGRRVRDGLRITAVATSERTASQAAEFGIPLSTLDETPDLDLVIDGADEVLPATLDLIKGLGGALLHERLVAAAGRRMVVVVDEGKLVGHLGAQAKLPVEIVAFGAKTTLVRLQALGVQPGLRRGADGAPFRTDGGNLIADCDTGPISGPAGLHARIKGVVGVIETGLFIGVASRVIVGMATGPKVLDRA